MSEQDRQEQHMAHVIDAAITDPSFRYAQAMQAAKALRRAGYRMQPSGGVIQGAAGVLAESMTRASLNADGYGDAFTDLDTRDHAQALADAGYLREASSDD